MHRANVEHGEARTIYYDSSTSREGVRGVGCGNLMVHESSPQRVALLKRAYLHGSLGGQYQGPSQTKLY